MAVSQYYGSRGSAVKEWQKKLNAAGATLAVDGVWGDKTEAAYNAFSGEKAQSAGLSYASAMPAGVTLLSADRLSDSELRRIAELSGRESYDLEQSQLESKYRRDLAAQETKRSRVEEDYGDAAAAIERAYGVKRQGISDNALSRGMGRSSYVLDMLSSAYDEQQASLLSALAEKQREIADIDVNIATLTDVLAENRDKLSRARLDSIEGMISKLKYEQNKAALEAQQYNNTLLLKLQELSAKATSSGRSGGSGGSGGSSKSAASQMLAEWGRLTDAGKIAWFSRNSVELRKADYQAYQDVKRQYDELKKTVVTSNPAYGSGNRVNSGGR